ncbi:hypothetical protein [Croceimicrobium hydrocarbonivorans]|uniref:Uncharacterized protein n=1 Tax=Croceimicrobium hydrocarbonivorans TaxID=2761580 RepID=A0A7H0VB95_9FLAO|nr:hypothetical protein [Croceimicrobium hydrocarbonivorans]QNR22950.1 hypothetical protein H4K34_11230 [Croceimicrobium hydrocarbonivorans]QNR22993.1 hypothetical protein H4K34_11445 [Croceimicrobium hydrocarbonivorans]
MSTEDLDPLAKLSPQVAMQSVEKAMICLVESPTFVGMNAAERFDVMDGLVLLKNHYLSIIEKP